MSTFEHLFGLIGLYGSLSKDNRMPPEKFLEHYFAVLDAWMENASAQEQQEAWSYSQHNDQAYISMWWFQQEQKQPTKWANAWNADKFVSHTIKSRLCNGAEEHLLQRMQWAKQDNDWDFFKWDAKFIFRVVTQLCKKCPKNPTLAEVLVGLSVHDEAMFCEIANALSTTYIQNHSHIIPYASSFLAQRQLVQALETKQFSHILGCLNKQRNELAQGPLLGQMGVALYDFWNVYQGVTPPDLSSSLETVAAHIADCFPKNLSQVLPPLGTGCCERWRIVSHVSNHKHLTGFVQAKTSNMLSSLFVFPQIDHWVEFWKETMSIPNWTPQLSNADDLLYSLDSSVRASIKPTQIQTIEAQMAPHWDFFDTHAPKMGRALAAIVMFLGGSAPNHLCNFSNLFNFHDSSAGLYPQGFQHFIEAHIQKQILEQSIDCPSSAKHRKI